MGASRIIARLIATVAVTSIVAGCAVFGTQGQGDAETQTRTVPAFVRVEVGDGIRAIITVGPVASVVVRAQTNIQPLVATQVADGTLRVHATEAYHTEMTVEVDITNPDIEWVSLSGGSHAEVTIGDVDSFQIVLSGGSNATAVGTTSALALESSGGSRADLGALHATHVALDMSGGSNATVLGGGTIDVDASGGSSVTPG